jgi:UDP-glucose 4-epimerase
VQVYGEDYPTPDGTCVRDYIHVADLATAHVQVLAAAALPTGVSFNVGTGVGSSVREVVRAVAARLGVDPRVAVGPRRPGDPAGWSPIRPPCAPRSTGARRTRAWKRSSIPPCSGSSGDAARVNEEVTSNE